MNITSTKKLNTLNKNQAAIDIVTIVTDGDSKTTYTNRLLLGPAEDVILCYEGKITLNDVAKKWGING